MKRLRSNDIVQIMSGKDKGKKGKVLGLSAGSSRAIVEGINLVKKHKRRTQQDQQTGITEVPQSVSCSTLMLICKNCNRPTRVGFTVIADGSKNRICKRCKEPL